MYFSPVSSLRVSRLLEVYVSDVRPASIGGVGSLFKVRQGPCLSRLSLGVYKLNCVGCV
jgi:hypothetical protein